MTRIITVTSGKGGVGKSTVSVNLAVALSQRDNKVCLIDGDFGLKNLDVLMGLENRVIYDLNDVIQGRCTISQVLIKDKRQETLFLLPACKTLSFQHLDIEVMSALLNHLKNEFDYILIDSPAGVEKGFYYACQLAHEAIVVVNLDLTTLRDNDRIIGLLQKQGIQQISLIFNKVNMDDIEEGRCPTILEARQMLSLDVLGIIYDDHDMIEANNKGIPIYHTKGHLLYQCFDATVRRLLGQSVEYTKYKKKGFLMRIFTS